MSDDGEAWEFPKGVQPNPEAVGFDLDRTLSSVLSLRSEVPDDAFSAATLGNERAGNGVVIGADGLVLTIGYLILEAESIEVVVVVGALCDGALEDGGVGGESADAEVYKFREFSAFEQVAVYEVQPDGLTGFPGKLNVVAVRGGHRGIIPHVCLRCMGVNRRPG